MSVGGPGDDGGGLGDLFIHWGQEFKEAEQSFHKFNGWRQALVVIASVIGGLFLIVGAFPAFVWAAKVLKPGEDEAVDKISGISSDRFQQGVGKPTKSTTLSSYVEHEDIQAITISKTAQLDVDVLVLGNKGYGIKGPDLPPNIHGILKEDCPFVQGKKVWQTHDLVLVPGKDDLQSIIGDSGLKRGESSKASYYKQDKNAKNHPHWILVTKEKIDVIAPDYGSVSTHLDEIYADFKEKNIPYELLPLSDLIFLVIVRFEHSGRSIKGESETYDATSMIGFCHAHVSVQQSGTKGYELHFQEESYRAKPYLNVLASRVFQSM